MNSHDPKNTSSLSAQPPLSTLLSLSSGVPVPQKTFKPSINSSFTKPPSLEAKDTPTDSSAHITSSSLNTSSSLFVKRKDIHLTAEEKTEVVRPHSR